MVSAWNLSSSAPPERADSLVHVEGVVGIELVAGSLHKLELVSGYTQRGEDCVQEERVVLDTVFEDGHGRFVGIQEGVELGSACVVCGSSRQQVGS